MLVHEAAFVFNMMWHYDKQNKKKNSKNQQNIKLRRYTARV